MKKIVNIIIIMALMLCCVNYTNSYAGWRGPDNYEDCILESMKGVTSDVAAKAIKAACRKKFPIEKVQQPSSKQLTPEELSKIEGNGGNIDFKGRLNCELYNGNENIVITGVTIQLQKKIYTFVFSETYPNDYPYKILYPRSAQSFRFHISTDLNNTNQTWSIIEAQGYEQ